MIVDDDLLSREVLSLLANEAGYDVQTFESGESALESLALRDAAMPAIVLADMQMPGISGESFARLLRSACGPSVALFAMSGTAVPPALTLGFDGFLLKPFSIDELATLHGALDVPQTSASTAPAEPAAILSPAVYSAFAQSMSPQQVRQLYSMCLDDADAKIGKMRQAAAVRDYDAYRRAAHSIKGGCGMVGATELAALAARMEESSPEAIDNIGPSTDLLDEFLAASARLRRILDAQYR
jgi:CheY-like chemotaxis protein